MSCKTNQMRLCCWWLIQILRLTCSCSWSTSFMRPINDDLSATSHIPTPRTMIPITYTGIFQNISNVSFMKSIIIHYAPHNASILVNNWHTTSTVAPTPFIQSRPGGATGPLATYHYQSGLQLLRWHDSHNFHNWFIWISIGRGLVVHGTWLVIMNQIQLRFHATHHTRWISHWDARGAGRPYQHVYFTRECTLMTCSSAIVSYMASAASEPNRAIYRLRRQFSLGVSQRWRQTGSPK